MLQRAFMRSCKPLRDVIVMKNIVKQYTINCRFFSGVVLIELGSVQPFLSVVCSLTMHGASDISTGE